MVGWIVLGLVLAPVVLFFALMIALALRRPEPRPAPPPTYRPTASAAPPAPAPTPTGTGTPDSSPEFTAWLAAYRRAHPNSTHAMEIAAVREWREDRTTYRGMSPGMAAARKAAKEQRRGTGWDGDWAR
ncbi:hypothetical protein [Streptacidiphilus sp. MAP5-3]|uniref:hypothetical protein n=1 Tax=unclassified Streptacidiphilus TaxID=2643834 RepID=UPI0035174D4C